MKQSKILKFWPSLIGVFLRLLQTIWTSSQRLWHHISVSVRICALPTRAHLTYNNEKPWFTAKLRQLSQAKEDAYRKGDKVLYKQSKCTLGMKIRVAKRNYSGKLRNNLSSSDSASVWKGMKVITRHKTPSLSTLQNQHLADELNEFYCRFEKKTFTPLATPPPALQIREDDVAPGLQKEQKKEGSKPRRRVTNPSEILCWPVGPNLQTDLQQITGAVRSHLMLQTLHHHPRSKETPHFWT